MATLPRHIAGQPFRAPQPILETLERPTFDTSGLQDAVFQVADRLDKMGETAQLPRLPDGWGQHEGQGLASIGQAIAGTLGKLTQQQTAARQVRDAEEGHALFQEGMAQYEADRQAHPDRPEKHPQFFTKAMEGLKNLVDKGDRFSKESEPIVRGVLQQNYVRTLPTVQSDAIRAQREQAISATDTGLERAVEQQDRKTGHSLIHNLLSSGLFSQQQAGDRLHRFETAFQAKAEQLAIDDAFQFARAGDLAGATERLHAIDPKRRKQVREEVEFTYRAGENERDVLGLFDRGKYRKAAVGLSRRNANGTFANWRSLSETRRDELLEQATSAYVDELKPVITEALKRRREGAITTHHELRRFFRERGQKLTPLFEEILDRDMAGRFESPTAKSAFFNGKIDGYDPEEDRGRVRYHHLLAALEVSGLPEGKAGTMAERLTRIADGEAEATGEQYARREFGRVMAPRVRRNGGRVRAERVRHFEDPESGQRVFYAEPTGEELHDPTVTVAPLPRSGSEHGDDDIEEAPKEVLAPDEPDAPSPSAPLDPEPEPAPATDVRILQLHPADQEAVLSGTAGGGDLIDLNQWNREERMADFLTDRYIEGLNASDYDSIEAAAKDMGKYVGGEPNIVRTMDTASIKTTNEANVSNEPAKFENTQDSNNEIDTLDKEKTPTTPSKLDPYALPDPENYFEPGKHLEEADKEELRMINEAAIGIIASRGEPGEDGITPEEYRDWSTGQFEPPSFGNGFNLMNETGHARRSYPGESDENIQLIESVKHNVTRARHLLPSSGFLSTTDWKAVEAGTDPTEKFDPDAPKNLDYYERLLSKISRNSVALDEERRELSRADYENLSPQQRRRNSVIGFSLLSNGLQSERAQNQIRKIMEASRVIQLVYNHEGEVFDPATLEVGSELYDAGRQIHNTGKAAELVASYVAGRAIEAGFNKILEKIATSRIGVTPLIPKGLSQKEWRTLSNALKIHAGEFDGEILIQGSRASYKAAPGADLDVAIRVSEKQFDELIKKAFGKPNPGSAKWDTMQEAIREERIFRRRLKLSGLGDRLEKFLGVKPVQITVIKEGGRFDYGYMIPIEPKNSRF